MAVNLTKAESMKQLDLRAEKLKSICSKKYNLSSLTSRVAVVLDISGSMRTAFETGVVQATLERLLPIALTFDDDGEMEFWTFNNEFQRHDPISKDNYYTYLKDNKIEAGGGTSYAPVIQDTAKYFGVESPSAKPAYVIFITDGDNNDQRVCDEMIKAASYFPVFYQFIGIGSDTLHTFKYLEKLDNMVGRYVDNANFFAIKSLADIELISDSDLYANLLKEYTQWLEYKEVEEMLYNVDDISKEKSKHIKALSVDYKAKLARADKRKGAAEAVWDFISFIMGEDL